MTTARDYEPQMAGIPGWFPAADFELFVRVLDAQQAAGTAGDLLEVGVYKGKTAVLLGCYASEGTALHLCDSFGDETALTPTNRQENDRSYAGLQEGQFRETYARFHSAQPTVWAVRSTELGALLRPASFRFIHLDGSHVYEVAVADLLLAGGLLTADGVVVLDDFRTAHTPGVAAAVWRAVARAELIPVVLSDQKLYAATTAPGAEALRAAVGSAPPPGKELTVETIAGHEVCLFTTPPWSDGGPPRSLLGRLASRLTAR